MMAGDLWRRDVFSEGCLGEDGNEWTGLCEEIFRASAMHWHCPGRMSAVAITM